MIREGTRRLTRALGLAILLAGCDGGSATGAEATAEPPPKAVADADLPLVPGVRAGAPEGALRVDVTTTSLKVEGEATANLEDGRLPQSERVFADMPALIAVLGAAGSPRGAVVRVHHAVPLQTLLAVVTTLGEHGWNPVLVAARRETQGGGVGHVLVHTELPDPQSHGPQLARMYALVSPTTVSLTSSSGRIRTIDTRRGPAALDELRAKLEEHREAHVGDHELVVVPHPDAPIATFLDVFRVARDARYADVQILLGVVKPEPEWSLASHGLRITDRYVERHRPRR